MSIDKGDQTMNDIMEKKWRVHLPMDGSNSIHTKFQGEVQAAVESGVLDKVVFGVCKGVMYIKPTAMEQCIRCGEEGVIEFIGGHVCIKCGWAKINDGVNMDELTRDGV
jgi:hypothetical protein